MNADHSQPGAPRRTSRLRRGVLMGLGFLFGFLIVAWGSLAIFYSNLPWHWARLLSPRSAYGRCGSSAAGGRERASRHC